MNSLIWTFSDSLKDKDKRITALLNPPTFQMITQSIKENMQILCCHEDPCRDFDGFSRVMSF